MRQPKNLYDLWCRQRRVVQINAQRARAYAQLQLGGLYLSLGLVVWQIIQLLDKNTQGAQGYALFLVVGWSVGAYLVTLWRKQIYQNYRRRLDYLLGEEAGASRPPNVVAINSEVAPDLLARCADMASRLGLKVENFRFYCDADDDRIGACMIESKGMAYVMFSSGFLKLWTEEPHTAEAIIAHELGHGLQRDTAAWIYVDSFANFYLPRAIAFALVQSLALLLMARFISSNEDLVRSAVFSFLSLPLVVSAYGLYFLFVRRGRRQSEKMADLVALMLTSPDALKAALQTPDERLSHNAELSNFGAASSRLSIHPSREARLQQISRLSGWENGLPENGVPATGSPRLNSEITARLVCSGCRLLFAACVIGVLFLAVSPTTSASTTVFPTFEWMCIVTASVGLLCIVSNGMKSHNPDFQRGAAVLMIGLPISIGLVWLGTEVNMPFNFDKATATSVGLVVILAVLLLGAWSFIVGQAGKEVE